MKNSKIIKLMNERKQQLQEALGRDWGAIEEEYGYLSRIFKNQDAETFRDLNNMGEIRLQRMDRLYTELITINLWLSKIEPEQEGT